MLALRLVAFQVACVVRDYRCVDFCFCILVFDGAIAGMWWLDLGGQGGSSDPIRRGNPGDASG